MPSKHDLTRATLTRLHGDVFGQDSRYSAEFFNYSAGSYNPDTGEVEGATQTSIGTTNIEFVPPRMDTTVDVDGTSFSWDTSARLPESDVPVGEFVPLGADNRKPTEVAITDPTTDETDMYELHGYSPERGSGMVMVRLVEQ